MQTVDEVCTFLQTIGVDAATVLRFRQNKVDSEAVSLFSNADYQTLGLTALADIAKLKQFCSCPTSENNEYSSKATSGEDSEAPPYLRQRRKKLLEMMKKNKRATQEKSGRPKKPSRSINVGLRTLNTACRDKDGWRVATTIKAPLGDKNCIVLKFSIDSTYYTLLAEIESAFFINGQNSVLGSAADYEFEVVNGRNENLNDTLSRSFTLGNYIEEKRIPGAIRLYLLCIPRNTPTGIDIDSDSDAMPEFDFGTPSGEVLVRRGTRKQTQTSTSSSTCTPNRSITKLPPESGAIVSPPMEISSATSRNTSCTSAQSTQETGNSYSIQQDYARLITYSDSEDEFQAAIEASLKECLDSENPEQHLDAVGCVMRIKDKVLPEERPTLVNVVRGKVLDGVSRAIKRPSFDPRYPLSVKFMDDVGTTEGAIDEGGPRREFFTLVAREIHDSPMFCGPAGERFIVPNQTALEKDLYFIAGVLISLSLAHGGAAPQMFSEMMYSWISKGPSFIKSRISLDDLPRGTDIYTKIHRVNDALDLGQLQAAAADMSDFLEVAGCNIALQDMKDKERLIRASLQFFMIDRTQGCMARFLEGISTLGVLETVREHPTSCKTLFCKPVDKLNLETMVQLFHPVLGPEGSNKRQKQVITLGYWNDYLSDIQDKQSKLQFDDILMFATGSDSVPPCGFDTDPQLQFLQDSPDMIYPTANTCTCILRLPVIFDDFTGFKNNFEFAVLNAVGFGMA